MDNIFIEVCRYGPLEKLKKMDPALVDQYFGDGVCALFWACQEEHLDIAKYLIWLGETKYGKINIHDDNECMFRISCAQNSRKLDIAKYLIFLGEEKGYGPVNIHACNEQALSNTCIYGNIEAAKYLIWLGENGYGRVDIHANNEMAFRNACYWGPMNLKMVKYLIWLGKNGYGPVDIHVCDDENMKLTQSFYIRHLLVQYEPDYNWSKVDGYKKYKTKRNKIISRLMILHLRLVQTKSDILDLNVISLIKDYLVHNLEYIDIE